MAQNIKKYFTMSYEKLSKNWQKRSKNEYVAFFSKE